MRPYGPKALPSNLELLRPVVRGAFDARWEADTSQFRLMDTAIPHA